MGFLIMLISFILGIFFIVLGLSWRNRKTIYPLPILIGIGLLIAAIYLARPH